MDARNTRRCSDGSEIGCENGQKVRFARDIGLIPRTTPTEIPQSNGMAEAFTRTLKRDYVGISSKLDARSVLQQLSGWIAHYNTVHLHRTLS